MSQNERPYKMCRNVLSVEEGVIIYEIWIVSPPLLHRQIIEIAHDEIHPSCEKTKAHIEKEFWWPGLERDIRTYIDRCSRCAEIRPKKNRKIDVWPPETEPWSRVHMDHCEVSGVGLLLLLSDAFSGWSEVVHVPDKSTETVLNVLRTVFARNGVPRILVSDNAQEFKSHKLSQWLCSVGCREMHTPPYHPASNGQAERLVRSMKESLLAWNKIVPFHQFLQKLLLTFRTSKPSGTRPTSPDLMMWGRRLRHPLTMIENVGDPIWLRMRPDAPPIRAKFVVQQGLNTALVTPEAQEMGGARLAHSNQWSARPERHKEVVTEIDEE